MSSLTTFVALDYHSDWIQVCILSRDGRALANRRVVFQLADLARFDHLPEVWLSDEQIRCIINCEVWRLRKPNPWLPKLECIRRSLL